MKFICPKSELLNGLQVVSESSSCQNNHDDPRNAFSLTVPRRCINLTANDMELGIETIVRRHD